MQVMSLEARGQVVLQILRATAFSPDADERRGAELALAAQGIEPGFALVLSMIACAGAMVPEPGERQLAAVVLKKHVKEHWDRDGRAFSPPEVSDEEKAMVRQTLLGGLVDDSSKVRTAIGMAIMAIANADYPHAWPDLIAHLVALIKEGRSVNGGELQGCQHRMLGHRDSWDAACPDTLAQHSLRLCVHTSLSKEYLQHPSLPVSCWRVSVNGLPPVASCKASCRTQRMRLSGYTPHWHVSRLAQRQDRDCITVVPLTPPCPCACPLWLVALCSARGAAVPGAHKQRH